MDGEKATGPDGVHPELLKPIAEVHVKHLTQLFKASLDEEQFQRYWLTLTGITVHKSGSRSSYGNYRPVSQKSFVVGNP